MTVTAASPARACPTTNINAGSPDSCVCVCRLALNVWRRWVAKESRRRKKMHGKLPDTIVETLKHPKQWQLDYQLDDTGPLGLYQEYSEMGILYHARMTIIITLTGTDTVTTNTV